jgi:Flp pilus assembly protein TadB
MKKYGIIVLAVVVIAAILYVTFIIALIEIAVGIALLVISAIIFWILWRKLKKKAEDKF